MGKKGEIIIVILSPAIDWAKSPEQLSKARVCIGGEAGLRVLPKDVAKGRKEKYRPLSMTIMRTTDGTNGQ